MTTAVRITVHRVVHGERRFRHGALHHGQKAVTLDGGADYVFTTRVMHANDASVAKLKSLALVLERKLPKGAFCLVRIATRSTNPPTSGTTELKAAAYKSHDAALLGHKTMTASPLACGCVSVRRCCGRERQALSNASAHVPADT